MYKKLTSIVLLIKSKGYILITDREAVVDIDYNSLTGVMAIHALQKLSSQVKKVLNEWKKERSF